MAALKTFLRAYAIWLIVLVGFALGVAMVSNNLNTPVAADERVYLNRAALAAANIWQDHSTSRPPLYPYALAVWYQIGGTSRFSIGIFQALLGVLSATFLYKLTRVLFRPRGLALLAALLFVVSPQALGLTGTVLSEPLFVCGMLAGFWLVARAVQRGGISGILLAGIFFALASLTREVIAYFALIAIPLWFILFANVPLRTRALQAFVFLAGMLLVLTPWVIRNYNVEQRFLLLSSSGEYNFARDNVRTALILQNGRAVLNGRPARFEIQRQLKAQPASQRALLAFQLGAQAIQETGLYWLGYKSAVTGAFWNPFQFEKQNLGIRRLPPALRAPTSFAVSGYLLALLVLATLGLIAAPDTSAKLLIALFLLYSFLLFILTHYQLRYRYPLYVMMTPFAAYGMWVVSRLVATRRLHPTWLSARRLLLTAGVLLCFVPLVVSRVP